MKQLQINELNTSNFQMQEAFKALRTNISFCGDDIKAIAVTSSFPNEGKTEVALRLAYAFAETGAKTILLDADIRNSLLAGKLNVNGGKIGLTHILSGKEKDISDAIYRVDSSNMYIIFAGPVAPNPAELFVKERFETLLETLRKNYDYIIIDCPPIMPVIDAAIIAKKCDGTIMVVAQNRVRKSDAKKALNQIKASGTTVLGTVLNKVQAQGRGYGYGYGYGKYGYGYGYGYGKTEETGK